MLLECNADVNAPTDEGQSPLIVAAASLSLTYIIEIEAICLLDVISGDRERMIAEGRDPDAPREQKDSAGQRGRVGGGCNPFVVVA